MRRLVENVALALLVLGAVVGAYWLTIDFGRSAVREEVRGMVRQECLR